MNFANMISELNTQKVEQIDEQILFPDTDVVDTADYSPVSIYPSEFVSTIAEVSEPEIVQVDDTDIFPDEVETVSIEKHTSSCLASLIVSAKTEIETENSDFCDLVKEQFVNKPKFNLADDIEYAQIDFEIEASKPVYTKEELLEMQLEEQRVAMQALASRLDQVQHAVAVNNGGGISHNELVKTIDSRIVSQSATTTSVVATEITVANTVNAYTAIDISGDLKNANVLEDSTGVLGLTINTGTELKVVSHGIVNNANWNFTPGVQLYLGNNGAIVESLPVDAKFVLAVGRSITSTTALLDFGNQPVYV